mmetsp:Transcript_11040/g.41155  ORF Transcript_11040/g.41155 Transcript_11040/m.41155 type:complete len:162 (-) Transcript_11040:1996-2481(-)
MDQMDLFQLALNQVAHMSKNFAYKFLHENLPRDKGAWNEEGFWNQVVNMKEMISPQRIKQHVSFHSGVDATNEEHLRAFTLNANVIWFQCPWDDNGVHNPLPLIQKFITAAARAQQSGQYLLIGIAGDSLYGPMYKFHKWNIAPAYRFLGADVEGIEDTDI